MGSACCVAAKDHKTRLPRRTSSEGPSGSVRCSSRNVRYSPTWSCRWDSQGHVAGEVENPPSFYSHGTSLDVEFESKDSIDVECGDLSERQSQVDCQISVLKKSPTLEHAGVDSMSSLSEPSMVRSSFNEVKDPMNTSAVADPSASSLSLSIPLTSSPCSMSNGHLSSQGHSMRADPTPSWQTRFSRGYHLKRRASDGRYLNLKSPNNSISEGRQSFISSTCSKDLTIGSQGGGSSDGWSMSTFSELVASSQRERWSFDSETLDHSRGKVTRSNSSFLSSPSVDLRTCGVCLKLLMEKSPWVAPKFIVSNELSVVAVLVCGHVYHADCLEHTTPETHRFDPPCPVCTTGDKQALKVYGKSVKIETDSKGRNRISRHRVVDSNLSFNYTVPDQWRSARREGKGPILGSSSSMKSTFTKPFLRRHFSLGSKSTKPLLDNESSSKSSNKGFWARYRKG